MEPVCVIIAAHNAAATVGAAIGSALAAPEVAEVVVVDDASTDATGQAAHAADDGTGRLRVETLGANRGPSAARNHAIACSTAPWLAVLDADDVLLPGRFRHLKALGPCDVAADNVLFFKADARPPRHVPQTGRAGVLGTAAFVRGNLTRAGISRGELGFLKPVLSRAFLDAHGLRYNEAMWLGEDYELLLRMLLLGAVFRVSHQPGYAARMRAGSLSAVHRTGDLWTQLAAEQAVMAEFAPGRGLRRAMCQRTRQIAAKAALRAALDARRQGGLAAALGYMLRHPAQVWPILRGVARDKCAPLRGPARTRRYLLPLD